jgi:hypothetical protein
MLLFIFGIWWISRNGKKQEATDSTQNKNIITEYVYVDRPTEDSTQTYETITEQTYVVREYMQRIGIFLTDGTLVKVIEVNTKTLPEADRRLLEEGFQIVGKQQLYSIIEDYGT